MNSTYKKNITLFKWRFPALAKMFDLSFDTKALPFEIQKAKSLDTTATFKGLKLHSAYDPQKEAYSIVQNIKNDTAINKKTTFVFESFGLGYLPIQMALYLPLKKIVIIEPDVLWLLASFYFLDWTRVLKTTTCVFFVATPIDVIVSFLEKEDLNDCHFFATQSQTLHANEYYTKLKESINKSIQKQKINHATLKRFSFLWQKNYNFNKSHFSKLQGVNIYKDRAEDLPFCVLAAGPSIKDYEGDLKEIKKRCVLVACNTALKFCLKAKTEPDFIVIMDPQFFAYQHIAGEKSPSSVLVAEPCVYPSVFDFECKKKVLCNSTVPLIQQLQKKEGFIKDFGSLSAGGSVATTAWDFARFCGAKSIITAGLDLGFPDKLLHYKGSVAEKKTHSICNIYNSAENMQCKTLFSADLYIKKDYLGGSILTDSRMSLYAWWFATHAVLCPTYNLGGKSLAIDGITPIDIKTLLQQKDITKQKQDFLNAS